MARMKIYDQLEQGSPEWVRVRCGKVTASEFGNLVTPAFEMRAGEMPETYLAAKIEEALYGPLPGFTSHVTEQGTMREEDAIPIARFEFNLDVRQVGFVEHEDGRCGCSPDGLIGDDSGLEIKCPQRIAYRKAFLRQAVPKEYLPQIHFSMFVTGRREWKLLSYCPPRPALLLTVPREEEKIRVIRHVLGIFYKRFDAALALSTQVITWHH